MVVISVEPTPISNGWLMRQTECKAIQKDSKRSSIHADVSLRKIGFSAYFP